MGKKIDNHDPQAKLALRRYMLNKYHAEGPLDVMDCCQGSGVLWHTLCKEFWVSSYWGLDRKVKKGRLKLDSSRVLAQPGWTQNVIDIDTYGSPWRHWQAMLPNISQPTTVFLTVGQCQMGVSKEVKEALGINNIPVPPGIAIKLLPLSLRYLLFNNCINGIIITEAVESVSVGTARYYGVHIEYKKTSGTKAATLDRSKPKQFNKDIAHV